MLPSIFRAVALTILLAGPAVAREIVEAPYARPIGFSEDGRYFAYEQYLNDTVSGSVLASIDVLDQETGRSVEGFPLGYLGMSKDGQYPLKTGDHAVTVDESQPDDKQLATLRRGLREAAIPKFQALGIRDDALRLAGTALTDRSRQSGPIAFALGAMVPGAVPDRQPVYRLSARIAPADTASCIDSKAKPQDHSIAIEITRPDEKSARNPARASVSIPWGHGDHECAQAAIVTDILASERVPADGTSHVVVLVLAVSWAPHAEAARYLAAFVKLP